jgi:hypothetical protein
VIERRLEEEKGKQIQLKKGGRRNMREIHFFYDVVAVVNEKEERREGKIRSFFFCGFHFFFGFVFGFFWKNDEDDDGVDEC